MKILWHSNSPLAASGYGRQTQLFASRLKRMLGHDVAVSAYWGLREAVIKWEEDITVYGHWADPYGNDALPGHARNHFGDAKDGLVIVLADIWVMNPRVLRGLRSAAWCPVDHDPLIERTAETLRKGKTIPIAMSRFGERVFRDAGFDPVYVPHGVNCNTFVPHDQAEARDAFGFDPDAFLLGMVAANISPGIGVPQRKNFPAALGALRILREKGVNAQLYLHTWLGGEYGGIDIDALVRQLGLTGRVHACDQWQYATGGFNDAYLSRAYSAMDVLVNPALGEGFGVPMVEAMACGVPVAATEFSSIPELVEGVGWLVPGRLLYTQFGSWQRLVSPEALASVLEEAVAEKESGAILLRREDARKRAVLYDADRVTRECWVPALAELERRAFTKRPAAAIPKRKAS